jgi:hypothetical protein
MAHRLLSYRHMSANASPYVPSVDDGVRIVIALALTSDPAWSGGGGGHRKERDTGGDR